MARLFRGPNPFDTSSRIWKVQTNRSLLLLSLSHRPFLARTAHRVPTLRTRAASAEYSPPPQTLLVVNNLSIPTANKRAIAIEHGGAAALGRLLCQDPGCHLLVMILVNLTFGDGSLNLELVKRRDAGTGKKREEGPLDFLMRSFSGGGEKEADGDEDGDVEDPQLIECICYALLVSVFFAALRQPFIRRGLVRYHRPASENENSPLDRSIALPTIPRSQLSSLTSDQLEKLGPITLVDEDGEARQPAELFASLTTMLSDEASAELLGPLDVASPDRKYLRLCVFTGSSTLTRINETIQARSPRRRGGA